MSDKEKSNSKVSEADSNKIKQEDFKTQRYKQKNKGKCQIQGCPTPYFNVIGHSQFICGNCRI